MGKKKGGRMKGAVVNPSDEKDNMLPITMMPGFLKPDEKEAEKSSPKVKKEVSPAVVKEATRADIECEKKYRTMCANIDKQTDSKEAYTKYELTSFALFDNTMIDDVCQSLLGAQ